MHDDTNTSVGYRIVDKSRFHGQVFMKDECAGATSFGRRGVWKWNAANEEWACRQRLTETRALRRRHFVGGGAPGRFCRGRGGGTEPRAWRGGFFGGGGAPVSFGRERRRAAGKKYRWRRRGAGGEVL